jgi:hypothetical protein
MLGQQPTLLNLDADAGLLGCFPLAAWSVPQPSAPAGNMYAAASQMATYSQHLPAGGAMPQHSALLTLTPADAELLDHLLFQQSAGAQGGQQQY